VSAPGVHERSAGQRSPSIDKRHAVLQVLTSGPARQPICPCGQVAVAAVRPLQLLCWCCCHASAQSCHLYAELPSLPNPDHKLRCLTCAQAAATEHVVHAARGTDHDVHAGRQDAGVLTHAGATHAGVALHLQV
jgi:hypothetical protein